MRRLRRLPPWKGAGSFPRPVPSLGLHATLCCDRFGGRKKAVKGLVCSLFSPSSSEKKSERSIEEPLSREDRRSSGTPQVTPQGLAVVQCTKGAARREINKAHGYGGIYLGNANNLLLIVECTYCVYSRCVMVNADWASCPGIVHEGSFCLVLENFRVNEGRFLFGGGRLPAQNQKNRGNKTQSHRSTAIQDRPVIKRRGTGRAKQGGGGHRTRVSKIVL